MVYCGKRKGRLREGRGGDSHQPPPEGKRCWPTLGLLGQDAEWAWKEGVATALGTREDFSGEWGKGRPSLATWAGLFLLTSGCIDWWLMSHVGQNFLGVDLVYF